MNTAASLHDFSLYSIHLLTTEVIAEISIFFLSSLCQSSLVGAGLIKASLCRYAAEEIGASRKNCSHLSRVGNRQCCVLCRPQSELFMWDIFN